MARREKIREACKDKKGDEYRACIRAEGGKTQLHRQMNNCPPALSQ